MILQDLLKNSNPAGLDLELDRLAARHVVRPFPDDQQAIGDVFDARHLVSVIDCLQVEPVEGKLKLQLGLLFIRGVRINENRAVILVGWNQLLGVDLMD